MKRWQRWLIRIGLVVVILGIVGAVTLNHLTYGAEDVALEVLDEPGVHTSRNLIWLEPETALANVVFYQGGLVKTEAYLVFASVLRDKGYRVFLPKMPLNLAIIRRDAFGDIKDAHPSEQPWIAIGHSLGGATLSFIADDAAMDALIFLGAYPAESEDLSALDIPVISIYGEHDTVLNREAFETTRVLLPEDTSFIEIPGGNHAWFGHYGPQRGDGTATITRAEQQQFVIDALTNLFE